MLQIIQLLVPLAWSSQSSFWARLQRQGTNNIRFTTSEENMERKMLLNNKTIIISFNNRNNNCYLICVRDCKFVCWVSNLSHKF